MNAQESIPQTSSSLAKRLKRTTDVLSDFTRDFLGIRNKDSRSLLLDIEMKEREFSRWLCSKLAGIAQRVETTTGPGIPDIWWSGLGSGACWIETKIVTGQRVLLRKEQYAWMKRAITFGSIVYVIAFEPKNEELWIYSNKSLIIKPSGKYLSIVNQPAIKIGKRAFNCSLLDVIQDIR